VSLRPPRAGGFTLSGERTSARALLGELWRSRELVIQISRKEFFVRYRRAVFGVVWAVALPVIQAVVLAVVLGRFVRFHTGGNYPLFIYSGTLAWSFFSSSVGIATSSIIDNTAVSAKIYFPRAVFPLTVVGSGLYGFAISVVVLLGLSLAVGQPLRWATLLLVPATVVLMALTCALSLLLSVLDVYFRDMKYLVQAVLIPLFYLTPVFYPLGALKQLQRFIVTNPMTGVVELFRAATVGADKGWVGSLWWTAAWTAVTLVAALRLHMRYDRVLSDLL
jgi:ABC-type polysaccharide/polyol phosphate export permease